MSAGERCLEDPMVLMQKMATEGFALTQRVLGRSNNPLAENQVPSLLNYFYQLI